MFRIERHLVKLGATRSVRVDGDSGTVVETVEEDISSLMQQADISAQELLSEARAAAEKILADAHEEAASIIISGKEQAEEDCRKAWEDGYADGAAEGKHSFDDELARQIQDNEESLKRVIAEIHAERELTYSTLENDVVSLALAIVKKVINPADENIAGAFESLIKNALKQIAPDAKIMLRVSPADYDRYFSSGNTVLELEGGVKVTASVLKDTSLSDFDCIIDQDNATVNVGLDTQLQQIELAFSKI